LTEEDPLKKDFRKFLWLIWDHLNLPKPTPLQYDIAQFLASPRPKVCIQAFRGVGKSFITSAYVLWELYKDPQKKVLVISASKNRADAFSTFTQRLITEVEVLKFLQPKESQRSSRIEFDVGPATADQSPSVKSVGITGQITGSRADLIIADDVEVLNNSATPDMREKLIERTREFSAVLKPLPEARIIYLGTPQTEGSIYQQLPETFETRIWPALLPSEEEAERYGEALAPYVRKMEDRSPGSTTDPQRFSDIDLATRKAEYGKAGFALQFMLNTQLSDVERYPLKIRDLLVMDVGPSEAPMKVNWMPDPKRELKELPNLAMAGDRFYPPAGVSETFAEFTGSVMSIDPSGRGKDETGYAVVKMLNGIQYVTRCGGLQGGYDKATLESLAVIAKKENVNQIIIESNMGDGMFTALFSPVLQKVHRCSIEEVRHSMQKERRIIETIEPVLAQHRLVFTPALINEDYRSAQAYEGDNRFTKSLIYQLTRITLDRGALKHDDRLDALSMAMGFWTEAMARDQDSGIAQEREEALMKDIEEFMGWTIGSSPKSNNWNPIYGR
jgi:hypothetical protein